MAIVLVNHFHFFHRLDFICLCLQKRMLFYSLSFILLCVNYYMIPFFVIWLIVDYYQTSIKKIMCSCTIWLYLTIPSMIIQIVFRTIIYNLNPNYWYRIINYLNLWLLNRIGNSFENNLMLVVIFYSPLLCGIILFIILFIDVVLDKKIQIIENAIRDSINHKRTKTRIKNYVTWSQHYIGTTIQSIYINSSNLADAVDEGDPNSIDLHKSRLDYSTQLFASQNFNINQLMLLLEGCKDVFEGTYDTIDVLTEPWNREDYRYLEKSIQVTTEKAIILTEKKLYEQLLDDCVDNNLLEHDFPRTTADSEPIDKNTINYGMTVKIQISEILNNNNIAMKLLKKLFVNYKYSPKAHAYKITLNNKINKEVVNINELKNGIKEVKEFMESSNTSTYINPLYGLLKASILAELLHGSIDFHILESNVDNVLNETNLIIEIIIPITFLEKLS